MAAMNSWEAAAYQQSQQYGAYADSQNVLFYQGVYSTERYDMMSILVSIQGRPNPQVNLGPVDLSCAMILCDLTQPDQPIVYANDAFCFMTGYTAEEVKGRNCRFLQAPGGRVRPKSVRTGVDERAIRKMRKAVDKRAEISLEVLNFKKNGQSFINILTMIPVKVEGKWHCVGFQCEKE
ncbi:vivid PAS protein VVD [Cercophora newfieldiana]|uniref:Vivid PAS protein VVD n=1 Tax=Cercophora newfieldiana TaxID=92897 RepID=A0AA39XV86_9PEZI|nr:vivid PAS protein VVD [Cercophora newfieldiana]